ncbi:transcriptional regulator [Bacillus licheniformis]|nr:transcriptional regulator [Bacillus licheniformis]
MNAGHIFKTNSFGWYVNDLQIKRVIEIEKQSGVLTNRIPVLRAEKGWTQKQLADLLGVTRQTVISIEKNKYKPSLLMGFRASFLFHQGPEARFLLSN